MSREEVKTNTDLEGGQTVVRATNGKLNPKSYITYIPPGYKLETILVTPSKTDPKVKIFVTEPTLNSWKNLQKMPFNENLPLCIEYPNENLEKKISKNEFLMVDWINNCNRYIFTSDKDFWKGRTIVPGQDINSYLKEWQTALSLKQNDPEI